MAMRFFTSFAKSMFDLNWLRGEAQKPGYAWSYFFLLVFFLTGLTLIPTLMKLPDGAEHIKSFVNGKMPDFNASWRGGELTVAELPQPYKAEIDNFVLVVDTISTGTLSIKNYLKNEDMSGLLVTKDRAEIVDREKNKEQTQYWKDMPDSASFNKKQVMEIVDKFITPTFVYLLGSLLFVFYLVASVISKLIVILLGAALINWIVIIKNKQGQFNNIFRIGLYVITLPAVINLIFTWEKTPVMGLQLGLFVLWLGVVVLGRKMNIEKV